MQQNNHNFNIFIQIIDMNRLVCIGDVAPLLIYRAPFANIDYGMDN